MNRFEPSGIREAHMEEDRSKGQLCEVTRLHLYRDVYTIAGHERK